MNAAASALWASIIRTVVPIIVGAVIAWVTGIGVALDKEFEPLLTSLLTGAFSALYYIAVRLLEVYVTPKLGWLLGLAKAPVAYRATPPKHLA